MLLDLIDLVTDDDLRALHDHLDGHDITPTGGVQLFLFRVADEEGSLAEVRDLIAARLAGEVTCEVYEYDDDQEEWIYDDEQAA
jgi:hypothetical protein